MKEERKELLKKAAGIAACAAACYVVFTIVSHWDKLAEAFMRGWNGAG